MRGTPDVVVSGANGTWADAGIEDALTRQFPNLRPVMLTPKHTLGECLGAGALMQVILATEELRQTGARHALVAALGWNQQAAAASIENTFQ